uniref:CSON007647 protein n=1 Tax=Culicoides sonorensis TaxID=179676 RepID=A0A336KD67_CULSO
MSGDTGEKTQNEDKWEDELSKHFEENIIHDGKRSKIFLANVPKYYTERAIRNLCGSYGTVNSVGAGPPPVSYYFVDFQTPEEAHYAIEQINQKFDTIRAEFAKSRVEKVKYNFIPTDDTIKMKIENRTFLGPFTKKYDTNLPDPLVKFNLSNELLSKIDVTNNFSDEFALCDILTTSEDIEYLESKTKSHKFENFVWTYVVKEEHIARMQKFLATSEGEYDEKEGVYFKRHPKFHEVLDKIGKCKICGLITTRKNSKTNEFFCSAACLEQDTEDLNKAPILPKDFQLNVKELTRNIYVVITSVISQNVVYVRPNDSQTTERYSKILQEVLATSHDISIIIKLPKVGDLVAVFMPNSNIYRAIVLKVTDRANIRVAFLDTGEISIQCLLNLRKLPEKLKALPIYIYKVILKDVPANYFNLNAVGMLVSLTYAEPTEELSIEFTDEKRKTARLYHRGKCVNDLLINEITIDPPETNEHYILKDVPTFKFTKTDNVKLIILDTSLITKGELSCIPAEYLQQLGLLHRKIQIYGKTLTLKEDHLYTPEHNEVCLVLLGQDWYRAVCYEKVGDQHPTMLCFDFGFFSVVHIRNIFPLPQKLLDKCYTFDCCIEGIYSFFIYISH